MTIQLLSYEQQPLVKEKLIGVMNFDFASGGKLSNSWVPGEYFREYSKHHQLDVLQSELNHILFDQLGTWEQVGDLVDPDKCLGMFEASDTSFYYAETDRYVFFIRLMPSDINKIFVYEK